MDREWLGELQFAQGGGEQPNLIAESSGSEGGEMVILQAIVSECIFIISI